MQITQVSTSQHRDYVPIKGWDGVEAALNAYNNGDINGSRATEQQLYKDSGEDHGNRAVGILALSGALMEQQKSRFVTCMLEQAKPVVADRGCWHGSYDYGAMGTAFFKTDVDIVLLDQEEDIYGISLNAAYVGDKPEANMATYYDVERGIKRCFVNVEAEPTSIDGFTFDFEIILRKLDDILGTNDISGEEVVAVMMADNGFGTPTFTLPGVNGYAVTIQPGCVGQRMNRVNGELVDRWSANGSCLLGNLERDYESDDENAKLKPTLRITVRKEGASDYGLDGLIWKTEEQEEIIALSNKIAAALR